MKILNSVFLKKPQITFVYIFLFTFCLHFLHLCFHFFSPFLGYLSSYLIGHWLVDWQVWKTLQGSSLERTWKAIYIPWSNLNTLKQPPLTLNTPSCSLRLYNLLNAQTKYGLRMSPSTKKYESLLFQWVQKNVDKIISINIFMASVPNCLSLWYTLNKL